MLVITLIGDFPDITVAGPPMSPGSTMDLSVHAVVVTADPESELPCLQGVRTGDVRPDPDATVLFTN